ncbi:MAG: hypothetical protein LBK71_08225 [Verrucomicrobiales bacterium]|jgi:hypothetical protein|nr:hypothetical protein [Verrucomicrobiales bacterium]
MRSEAKICRLTTKILKKFLGPPKKLWRGAILVAGGELVGSFAVQGWRTFFNHGWTRMDTDYFF